MPGPVSQPPRVLVTRPQEKADACVARFAEYGIEAWAFPAIHCSPAPQRDQQMTRLARHSGGYLLFVSVHAVDYFLAHPLAEVCVANASAVYAIGAATASRFEYYTGVTVTTPPRADSEHFLAMLESRHIDNQHWYIIRAQSGRALIQETLRDRGARVTNIVVYQREYPGSRQMAQMAALVQDKAVTCLVCTTFGVLQYLYQHFVPRQRLQALAITVVNERMADWALRHGFAKIVPVQALHNEALVQAVWDYFEDHGDGGRQG